MKSDYNDVNLYKQVSRKRKEKRVQDEEEAAKKKKQDEEEANKEAERIDSAMKRLVDEIVKELEEHPDKTRMRFSPIAYVFTKKDEQLMLMHIDQILNICKGSCDEEAFNKIVEDVKDRLRKGGLKVESKCDFDGKHTTLFLDFDFSE